MSASQQMRPLSDVVYVLPSATMQTSINVEQIIDDPS